MGVHRLSSLFLYLEEGRVPQGMRFFSSDRKLKKIEIPRYGVSFCR